MKRFGKKYTGLLALILALCMLLCACGDEGDVGGSAGDVSAAQPTSAEPAGSGTGSSTVQSSVSGDGLERGSGLVMGEVTANLDENPNRTIRRSVEPIRQSVSRMYNGKSLDARVYFYRNTLDSNGAHAYDQLRAGMLKGQNPIQMTVPVSPDDIFDIYQMVVFDSPDLFWVETSMSYSYNNYGNVTEVYPGYNDLVYDIAGNTAALEAAVSEALGDMWSLDGDVEKAKYAHDYLTHTNDYVLGSPHNQNAWSALVNGQTVCAGYSHGFQYMMQKMGIPCAYIVGYAGENHAWNLVYLDGEYYAMDVTWDDPLGAGANDYYYDYFNITDDQLSRDHARDNICADLPWGTGTAASYQNYFGGNAYGTGFDDIYGEYPGGYGDDDGYDVEDNEYLPGDDGEEDWDGEEEDGNPYLPDGFTGEEEDPYLPSEDDWSDEDDWGWVDEDEDLTDWDWDFDYDDGSWDDYWSEDWTEDTYDCEVCGLDVYECGDCSVDYTDSSFEWWSALDSNWSKSDWEYVHLGDDFYAWEIWDEETQAIYYYEETAGDFYCMDTDETFYMLNQETGEWEIS